MGKMNTSERLMHHSSVASRVRGIIRVASSPTVKCSLTLGNAATRSEGDQNLWEWSMFLQAGQHATNIDKVILRLHPTFEPNEYEYTQCDESGTFRSGTFTGWGTFPVKATVCWKGGMTSDLEHTLVFERNERGASTQTEVI